jgi:hypothetical protein
MTLLQMEIVIMGPKGIVKLGQAVLSVVNIIFDLDISCKC